MSARERAAQELLRHQMLASPARCGCGWEGRRIEDRWEPDWQNYPQQFAAHVAAVLASCGLLSDEVPR